MKAQFKGIYTFVSAKNVNFANFFFFPILHQVPNAAVISLLCIISQSSSFWKHCTKLQREFPQQFTWDWENSVSP